MAEPPHHKWKRLPFREIVETLISGGTPSTEVPEYWGGNTPWITGADFKGDGIEEFRRWVTSLAVSHSSTNIVKQGDLLLVTRTGVGKMALAPCDIAISQDITGVVPRAGLVSALFLFYRMKFGVEYLKRLNQGTSINGIIRSDLLAYELDIPPLGEQLQIAILLSTLDTCIERTNALIRKYRRIKDGMMRDLFTRGVTKDGWLRPPRSQAPDLYKETPIGWIPKEWDSDFLDDVAARASGHTPNKSTPEYWDGGIKWVSLADSPKLDQLYISKTEKEISLLGIQNSSAVLHPAGVVILSRDAGVGKSAITTEPMAVSQHFMVWNCGAKLNRTFLYYWLQFKKREFENIAMGSTILTIGLDYFRKLKISRPTRISEQDAIVSSLLANDNRIFSEEAVLRKLVRLKSGLMHDLLTGKVKINALEENEPNHV